MEKTQQMGSGRSEDRQPAAAPRKRPQQQQGAQTPVSQQSGGEAGSAQMQSTQFTDWASI